MSGGRAEITYGPNTDMDVEECELDPIEAGLYIFTQIQGNILCKILLGGEGGLKWLLGKKRKNKN